MLFFNNLIVDVKRYSKTVEQFLNKAHPTDEQTNINARAIAIFFTNVHSEINKTKTKFRLQ